MKNEKPLKSGLTGKERGGRSMGRRALSVLMIALTLLQLVPFALFAGEYSDLETEQPILVVTGEGIVGDMCGVAGERSYTMDELTAMEDPAYFVYSWLNTSGTRRIYKGKGVTLSRLFENTAFAPDKYGSFTVDALQYIGGTYSSKLDLSVERFYFSDDGTVSVPTILATKSADNRDNPPVEPADSAVAPRTTLLLLAGQTDAADANSPLANSNTQMILVGSELPAALSALGVSYTRAQLLMMPRAQRVYTYSSSGGERNDLVRGVPLGVLLGSAGDDQMIAFHSADNFDNSAYSMTKAELISKNAMLAYELDTAGAWVGYYDTAKNDASIYGYFRLFVDGMRPTQMIDGISIVEPARSEYKHIAYNGPPYNLDAITGATLTVEGPGVVNSTPISVRFLESTSEANIHKGVYRDTRAGVNTERFYEGVTLRSILDGLVDKTVERLDDNVVVVFKNRWRQDVARVAYSDILGAAKPLIIAYGTANADGANARPFVFNMASGEDVALGNGDGPLKLVYDQDAVYPSPASALPSYAKFASVAYLYIEEGTPPPGYKHIEASDEAYRNVANTEHLITFTGGALGREVNYSVGELEAMVEYGGDGKPLAGGVGHIGEYCLSNTTYWYVNEYEGVKVWDLLTSIMGLDGEAYKNDENTSVSFSAWDNWAMDVRFSMKQLADPDLFYFYEKSPLDVGSENRPSKNQLATTEYQPDNRIGEWDSDHNGYPVKKGYPVMLAYGVNGYPYARESSLPGFKGGLGNSGGPMRVIYGKADGLTQAAPENYAYFFNNGSKQLKAVQEVYVGDETRYSTHFDNPDPAYQAMKADAALTVEIVSDGEVINCKTFSLEQLEKILYGVSKKIRDDSKRQEKGYYVYRTEGSPPGPIQDLFEGVSLRYLLTESVGIPGVLGNVELYSGASLAAVYDLSAIGEKGANSLRRTSGLGMMVAFAKNGYPLVAGVGGSSSAIPGYVHNDAKTGLAIRNDNGPLVFVRGQTDAEYAAANAADMVNTSNEARTYVPNLTKIVARLDADSFAHVGSAYADYAAREVSFTGAVASPSGVSLTVGALETKQRYMITGSYAVGGVAKTYRGLDLYALLKDDDIRASNMMSAVTVKNAAGQEKSLSLSQLTAGGKKIILAYGVAGAGDLSDAAPLVTASGGPMRLIIDGGSEADCIAGVSEIAVSGSELGNWWKHNAGVYLDYTGPAYNLEVSGTGLVHNKTYTVAELEAMEDIFVSDYFSEVDWYVQGVDLYKLLLSIGIADGADITVKAIASSDNYTQTFTASQVRNGAGPNAKPLVIAFGRGNKNGDGLPLVPSDGRNSPASPGFDAEIGNSGGPLRLIPDTSGGNSVQRLTRIVVGAEGGNPDPSRPDDKNFSFDLYPGGVAGMPQASIRAIATDQAGGVWIGTNGAGAVYMSPAGAITRYATDTTPALRTNFVTGIAIAPDSAVWLTQGGSVGSQNAAASEHFGFARFKDGQFAFYDASSAGSTLPSNCVYGIDVDKDGVVWVSSQHTAYGAEGGLTRFNPATNAWHAWKMADGLPTSAAWTVKSDGKGGAWVTTYRTSNVSGAVWPDVSYAHVDASGQVRSYAIPDGKNFTWSRSISVDSKGGAYITRMSGAHDPANDGGWLDYIAPDGSVRTYKGDDLIPDLKAKAKQGFYPEIRTVFVDAAGDLWLSTNGLGVFKCNVSGGVVSVVENYYSGTGCWPAGSFDDIWSIWVSADRVGLPGAADAAGVPGAGTGTVYCGSNGGLATKGISIIVPVTDYIGDATPETAQISVTGAVEKPGYFTMSGLRNSAAAMERTLDYSWRNSVGSTDTDTISGVYLEDMFTGLLSLKANAVSLTLTAADGFRKTINLSDEPYGAYWTDREGNKIMLAWRGTNSRTDRTIVDFALPRLIVGQQYATDVNRSEWVNDIVSIVVNAKPDVPDPEKPAQPAPTGLTGVKPSSAVAEFGRINSTTTAMEYSADGLTWLPCGDGYTEVAPGQYYVRFAETQTRKASVNAEVSVPAYTSGGAGIPDSPGKGKLSINGIELTMEEINLLPQMTITYSSRNTQNNWYEDTDISGVRLSTLFSEVGLTAYGDTLITFYEPDPESGLPFSFSFKADDLQTPRYYFSEDGARGAEVPAILSFNDDGGRLFFGQLTAREQTRVAFVRYIDRIVIGGKADTWGAPSANPRSRSAVTQGAPIRLYAPAGSGDAKIYYTFGEATPTVESDMYNVIAERWFQSFNITENAPILAPDDGPFVLKAAIIGLGKNDGPVATFYYNGAGPNPGISTSITGTGAVVVTVSKDKIPEGRKPVIALSADDLKQGIEDAVSEDGNGTLELTLNTPDEVASVEVKIQAESLKDMIDSRLKQLIIGHSLGSVSFDLPALKALYSTGAGDALSFIISKVDVGALDKALRDAVGENPLYEILVTRGGAPVENFKPGQVVVHINHKLKTGQNAFGLKVWHVSKTAVLTGIDSTYNSARSRVQFTRSSLSYYMIGYDAESALWKDNPFADVKKEDWFYNAVRFVYERGLMTGTSTDPMLFSPNMTFSRGMVVTVLHRLAGSPGERIPAAAGGGQFYDVAEDAYYYQAVNWAAANKIVAGYGGGKFGPDDNVAREQLAAILHNYSKWRGIDVSVGENTNILSYNDAFDVSEWAIPAMQWACGSGVIGGKPGGILDPRGSATRAESAAMFERFISNVVER